VSYKLQVLSDAPLPIDRQMQFCRSCHRPKFFLSSMFLLRATLDHLTEWWACWASDPRCFRCRQIHQTRLPHVHIVHAHVFITFSTSVSLENSVVSMISSDHPPLLRLQFCKRLSLCKINGFPVSDNTHTYFYSSLYCLSCISSVILVYTAPIFFGIFIYSNFTIFILLLLHFHQTLNNQFCFIHEWRSFSMDLLDASSLWVSKFKFLVSLGPMFDCIFTSVGILPCR